MSFSRTSVFSLLLLAFFSQGLEASLINQHYYDIEMGTYYLKGEEALDEKDNSRALIFFKKALSLSPHSPHIREKLAHIYMEEGLFAEASSAFKILEAGKNKELSKKASMALLEIYFSLGLFKKALFKAKKLSRLKTQEMSFYLKYAYLKLQETSSSKKALEVLRPAFKLNLNPEEKAQVLLAQAHLEAYQDQKKSLRTLRRIENLGIEEEKVALKVADFYKLIKKEEKAFSFLKKYQERRGGGEKTALRLLDDFIDDQNWKEAEKQLSLLQSRGHMKSEHYLYKSLLLMEREDFKGALLYLKDLNRKDPGKGHHVYLLGKAHLALKNLKTSLKHYSQVSKNSPFYLASQIEMADVFEKKGEKIRSLNKLKKLSFPKGDVREEALLVYAEKLWMNGRKKQALKVLTEGIEFKPSQTDFLLLRAHYSNLLGKKELALKDIKKILEQEKDHPEALRFLAGSS